jgi:hypothetical protein
VFSETSSPALGLTESPIQKASEAISLEVNLTFHLHL